VQNVASRQAGMLFYFEFGAAAEITEQYFVAK